jgi:hypothetical protein
MKATSVSGYGIVNPWSVALMLIKLNAFQLLLDISGYVTSCGLVLPILSDTVVCITLGGMLIKMDKEMIQELNLFSIVDYLLFDWILFVCSLWGLSIRLKVLL